MPWVFEKTDHIFFKDEHEDSKVNKAARRVISINGTTGFKKGNENNNDIFVGEDSEGASGGIGGEFTNGVASNNKDGDADNPKDAKGSEEKDTNKTHTEESGGTPSGGTPSGGTPSGGTPSGGIPPGGTPSGGTPLGGAKSGDPFKVELNTSKHDDLVENTKKEIDEIGEKFKNETKEKEADRKSKYDAAVISTKDSAKVGEEADAIDEQKNKNLMKWNSAVIAAKGLSKGLDIFNKFYGMMAGVASGFASGHVINAGSRFANSWMQMNDIASNITESINSTLGLEPGVTPKNIPGTFAAAAYQENKLKEKEFREGLNKKMNESLEDAVFSGDISIRVSDGTIVKRGDLINDPKAMEKILPTLTDEQYGKVMDDVAMKLVEDIENNKSTGLDRQMQTKVYENIVKNMNEQQKERHEARVEERARINWCKQMLSFKQREFDIKSKEIHEEILEDMYNNSGDGAKIIFDACGKDCGYTGGTPDPVIARETRRHLREKDFNQSLMTGGRNYVPGQNLSDMERKVLNLCDDVVEHENKYPQYQKAHEYLDRFGYEKDSCMGDLLIKLAFESKLSSIPFDNQFGLPTSELQTAKLERICNDRENSANNVLKQTSKSSVKDPDSIKAIIDAAYKQLADVEKTRALLSIRATGNANMRRQDDASRNKIHDITAKKISDLKNTDGIFKQNLTTKKDLDNYKKDIDKIKTELNNELSKVTGINKLVYSAPSVVPIISGEIIPYIGLHDGDDLNKLFKNKNFNNNLDSIVRHEFPGISDDDVRLTRGAIKRNYRQIQYYEKRFKDNNTSGPIKKYIADNIDKGKSPKEVYDYIMANAICSPNGSDEYNCIYSYVNAKNLRAKINKKADLSGINKYDYFKDW